MYYLTRWHQSQSEPCWLLAGGTRRLLPEHYRLWLLHKGSLTERLLHLSQNQLTVEVLRQVFSTPYLSEARLLGLSPRRKALIREVVLYGRERPWVFARSILPLTTVTGRLRSLRKLDNRPLGGLLFKDPSMKRGPIEIAAIGPSHRYLPKELQIAQSQWGRRSVFYLDNKPLLVSEVFLHTFKPWHCHKSKAISWRD